jgi:integrase
MGNIKPKTVESYLSTLNAFENYCAPQLLAEASTAKVTAFARELRLPRTVEVGKWKNRRKKTTRRTEASVAKHLRQLKAVLGWAHRQGLINTRPTFDMPKRASGARRMKGRPITLEEFERMLAATPKVVGEAAADSWKLLLRGLWVSGLRLSEAMALRWDEGVSGVAVVLSGTKSVLAFDADSQKSGKVELVPLAPEAVELLEPLQRPTGYVFRPTRQDGEPMARDTHKISKVVSRIGKAATVVVDPKKGKSASAHDLRRAFGYRWSRKVMPALLKELMRHSSIETTMTYYVGQNAQASAEELWAALGSNGQSEACLPPAETGVSSYNN